MRSVINGFRCEVVWSNKSERVILFEGIRMGFFGVYR